MFSQVVDIVNIFVGINTYKCGPSQMQPYPLNRDVLNFNFF